LLLFFKKEDSFFFFEKKEKTLASWAGAPWAAFGLSAEGSTRQ
jgi:hypothetical protein